MGVIREKEKKEKTLMDEMLMSLKKTLAGVNIETPEEGSILIKEECENIVKEINEKMNEKD